MAGVFILIRDVITGNLPKLYSKAWKSDFVQVTHHGYGGGTDELYDLISPTYAMWPTAQYFFHLVKEGKWQKAHILKTHNDVIMNQNEQSI